MLTYIIMQNNFNGSMFNQMVIRYSILYFLTKSSYNFGRARHHYWTSCIKYIKPIVYLKTIIKILSDRFYNFLFLKYLLFPTNSHIISSLHSLQCPERQYSNPIREIAFELVYEKTVVSWILIFACHLLFFILVSC